MREFLTWPAKVYVAQHPLPLTLTGALCSDSAVTCLMHMSTVSADAKPCRLQGQTVHVR